MDQFPTDWEVLGLPHYATTQRQAELESRMICTCPTTEDLSHRTTDAVLTPYAQCQQHDFVPVLKPLPKGCTFGGFRDAMSTYRATGKMAHLTTLFCMSKIDPQGTDSLSEPFQWMWHMHTEPRIRDNRLIVQIKSSLAIESRRSFFTANWTKFRHAIFESRGCIHLANDSGYKHELYAAFAAFVAGEHKAVQRLGMCLICNTEVFVAARRTRCQWTYALHGNLVWDVVQYVNLGTGRDNDFGPWAALTQTDPLRHSRIQQLWQLERAFNSSSKSDALQEAEFQGREMARSCFLKHNSPPIESLIDTS